MMFCVLTVLGMTSCKHKKNEDIIIVHKPMIIKHQSTQKIGDAVVKKDVRWLGADYTVTVITKADRSLPLATDGITKYFDNRITINIARQDGSVFFNRTFSKADFKPYVDKAYYKDGALTSIVVDKAHGNSLDFAVSVGSPDKASEELVPLEMTVSNLGAVTIKKISEMDGM